MIRHWKKVLAGLTLLLALQAPARASVTYATGFDDGTVGSLVNRTTLGFTPSTASTGTTGLPSSATYSITCQNAAAFLDYTQTSGAWCEQITCQSQMAGVAHGVYGTGSRANIGLSLCDDGSGNAYEFLYLANTGQTSNAIQITKWSSNRTVANTIFNTNTGGGTGPALGLIPDLGLVTAKFQYDGANQLSYKLWTPLTMHEPTTWMGTITDPAPYNTSNHNKAGLWMNMTRTSSTTNGSSNTSGATTLTVASTTNFTAGAQIQIGNDTGTDKEFRTITSVTNSTQMVVPALTNTHVAGETVANAPPTYGDNFYCGPPGSQFTPIASTPSVVTTGAASVTLSWNPPTGGSAPFVYDVVRATDSGFTQNVTKVASLISSTYYQDTSVSASTTYYYRTQVRDSVMNGTGTTTDANLPLDCISSGVSTTTLASSVAATTYTVTPPTLSGQVNTASGTWLVQSVGYLPSQNLVVTAMDGATQVAQVTVTPNGSVIPVPAHFTFTPTTTGIHSLTFTHTYSGTPAISSDPGPITYTSNPASYIISPVNTDGSLNPAVHMSPANWSGDGGTSSSSRWGTGNFVTSIYPGAYFTTCINSDAGGTANLVLDTTSSPYPAPAPAAGSILAYSIDGNIQAPVVFDNVWTNIPLTYNNSCYLPAGSHKITVYLDGLGSTATRWVQGNEGTTVFRPKGIQVDGGTTVGTAPASKGWWMLIGDSICGEYVVWNLTTSGGAYTYNPLGVNTRENIGTYSYYISRSAQALGYDVSVQGISSEGWIAPGNAGDVPGYYPVVSGVLGNALWNQIDGLHSRLDSSGHISGWGGTGQEPSVVHSELFVNDVSTAQSQTDLQNSITGCLSALRGALKPNTPIILSPSPTGTSQPLLYPTAPTYMTYVQSAYNTYIGSSADPYCYLDILSLPEFGQVHDLQYTPNFHPTAYGAALLGTLYEADIISKQFLKSQGSGIRPGGKL